MPLTDEQRFVGHIPEVQLSAAPAFDIYIYQNIKQVQNQLLLFTITTYGLFWYLLQRAESLHLHAQCFVAKIGWQLRLFIIFTVTTVARAEALIIWY
jgi:hypothetical protein